MSTADIDYGLGRVNIDQDTGIRYGVLHHSVLGQAWYDESEGDYGEPRCPDCGFTHVTIEEHCPQCGTMCESWNCYPDSPLAWVYEDSEYSMVQSGDDCDIFVTRSPYFTYCGFCSPCAPGAGYIMEQLSPEFGIRAYCPGPEWFEEYQSEHGGLPIVVYRVDTGRIA